MNPVPPQDDQYQISAVARLTGLSVHTIRAWEKRYGVVSPERTDTDRRLYSREDIRRLTLLKTLVDHGQAIGTIATLSIEQLEARLRETQFHPGGGSEPAPAESCRVAVIGPPLLALMDLANRHPLDPLEVAVQFASLEEALKAQVMPQVELALFHCPNLFPEMVRQIQVVVERLGARRALAIYDFSASAVAQQAAAVPRLTVVRGPVNSHELLLACLADIRLGSSGRPAPSALAAGPAPVSGGALSPSEIPPRRFTSEQLFKICRLPTTLECECPRHLANLLLSLCAFETYSEQCVNRSPQDAQLHAMLHQTTAQSRSKIEDALVEVLRNDGIEI